MTKLKADNKKVKINIPKYIARGIAEINKFYEK